MLVFEKLAAPLLLENHLSLVAKTAARFQGGVGPADLEKIEELCDDDLSNY